jgi:pimeloyl-ACP methyl ester carboxylesterase
MAAPQPAQPDSGRSHPCREAIVILGGFMSMATLYNTMRLALVELTGQIVYVVETRSADWIPSVVPAGWLHLLRKLDDTVRQAARHTAGGRVTVIGHSAGGVLARLYLSPEPFLGQVFRGMDHVGQLITLGSPHYNRRRWIHGGMMARWVDDRVPGSCFAPQVHYCSVAGKLFRGDREGSLRERHAYSFYEQIEGKGDVWGDGLVPVDSALLAGSQHVILKRVGHFAGFGGPWYGTDETIPSWWSPCQAENQMSGASPPGEAEATHDRA